jgi:hypothetical protein
VLPLVRPSGPILQRLVARPDCSLLLDPELPRESLSTTGGVKLMLRSGYNRGPAAETLALDLLLIALALGLGRCRSAYRRMV